MPENKNVLPRFPESYWRSSVQLPSFPKLTNDITTDIVIVGGGITGITAAYLLAKEGFQVALLEAGTIFNGTTGHTTAKITAQHDLIYYELANHFGEEKAKLYYNAQIHALHFIRNKVRDDDIPCDFREQDAYIYTNSDKYVKKLNDEFAAYDKLGIENAAYVETLPFPLPVKAAVVMKNQAQFHPLRYLLHLVDSFHKAGGQIYENTTADEIVQENPAKVVTRDGRSVTGKQVIVSSHFPFNDPTGFYFARMYASRSYALAVKTERDFPGGMYLSAEDPTRSLRSVSVGGEDYVIVGGEGHKTGQGICTMKHYENLRQFGEEVFGIRHIAYRWSTQDLITLDKVPYIGPASSLHPHIYVATGYRKWGMTNGTAAALLLKDLIIGKDNPYRELFTPSRFQADPSIKNFIVQNADVAAHLVSGKLEIVRKKPEDLQNDEGAAVTVNGRRVGAYKGQDGQLHIVDATCTHMGCELEWNSGERTWDCPCHGSRFSYQGEVVEGPAKKPLARIE